MMSVTAPGKSPGTIVLRRATHPRNLFEKRDDRVYAHRLDRRHLVRPRTSRTGGPLAVRLRPALGRIDQPEEALTVPVGHAERMADLLSREAGEELDIEAAHIPHLAG